MWKGHGVFLLCPFYLSLSTVSDKLFQLGCFRTYPQPWSSKVGAGSAMPSIRLGQSTIDHTTLFTNNRTAHIKTVMQENNCLKMPQMSN